MSVKAGMRREYDIAAQKSAVRGKYYQRAVAGTNLVLIEPDIARVFPGSEAVDEALRGLIDGEKSRGKNRRTLKLRRKRLDRRS